MFQGGWQHAAAIRRVLPGQGFAVSSVEGRVAVEYFDNSEAAQSRKFAFKCHRRSIEGVDTAFPVNTIAFHPQLGTFATGGELSPT